MRKISVELEAMADRAHGNWVSAPCEDKPYWDGKEESIRECIDIIQESAVMDGNAFVSIFEKRASLSYEKWVLEKDDRNFWDGKKDGFLECAEILRCVSQAPKN